MGHHLFNPYSPCCCEDGQICPVIQGCYVGSGVGFHVAIVDDATGETVGEYDSSPASDGFVDCTDLVGDRAYTITIGKPRWKTRVIHLVTPCEDAAWRFEPTYTMEIEDGYCCPCFGYGCTEPVKMPISVNDGMGDVELSPTLGPCAGQSACATRSATGSDDCCAVETYYGDPVLTDLVAISTPIQIGFSLVDCGFSLAVAKWCEAIVGFGPPPDRLAITRLVPTAGSCGDDPCSFDQITNPGEPCGTMTPAGPPTVTCAPFTVTQTFHLTGCLVDVYGATVTLTAMEAA